MTPHETARISVEEESEGTRARSQRRPFLFLVLDCDRPLAGAERIALGEVEEVVVGRGDERVVAREGRRVTVRVPDPWMSAEHARFEQRMGRWRVDDAGSRNGTVVGGARTAGAFLADGDLVELGRTIFRFRAALPAAAEDDCDASVTPGPLASLLPSLCATARRIALVAPAAVSLLLHGETGTGKEVLAREVHRLSARGGDFVAINCGALPETLLESELFGAVKGAFSGATADRVGLVRSAHGGTLFLDEIGDLPLASQAAFLRVLQEREVTPVGGTRPVPVNLRLVAATHRDLEALVGAGAFRADLYARLVGLTVSLPPLRQRREDLGLLVAALLARHPGGAATRFEPAAARELCGHAWPLNVRELEKTLGVALALAAGRPIAVEHLPERAPVPTPAPDPIEEAHDTLPFDAEELALRERLMALLEEHRGNVAAVAREVGKARMQVLRWLKRLGLEAEAYRR